MVADSREALRRGAAPREELRSLAIVPGLCPRLRSSLLADLLGRGGVPAAIECAVPATENITLRPTNTPKKLCAPKAYSERM